MLEARVVICSYNPHICSLSAEPFWLVSATKVYSGLGVDIVMESITLSDLVGSQFEKLARLKYFPDVVSREGQQRDTANATNPRIEN